MRFQINLVLALFCCSASFVYGLDQQDATRKKLPSFNLRTLKDCTECPLMVVLNGGSYLMGSPPISKPKLVSPMSQSIGPEDDKPQHRVQIQSFAIGKYEVTQSEWLTVMGANPSENTGLSRPVDQVSWKDVQEFIRKLNNKTGQKFRLPSEAEWEYAARGGSETDWSHGSEDTNLPLYAWFYENSEQRTQLVGEKLPNPFGLYDMHGNVWEWVQDCWHMNYLGAPSDGRAWTSNCGDDWRVIRGGSVNDYPPELRSAYRSGSNQNERISGGGFRLAKTLSIEDQLRELKGLYDKGVVTKDQFEKRSSQILENL